MKLFLTLFLSLIIFLYVIFIGSFFAAPWVPTKKKDYDRIAKLANLRPGMVFYDLGSGTANMLFYFSKKYKISCVGIEISPFWFFYSKIKSLFYKNVKIKYGNLYKYNISKADVIYVFLLPEAYPKLKKKIDRELRAGAKLVFSYWPLKNHKENDVSKKENSAPYYLYQK